MEVVQESTGKRFALKQLLASRRRRPSSARSFEFEARLGMQLRHPNLIQVHEYFRDPDQPYFIMDLFPSVHLKLPIARPVGLPDAGRASPPDHHAGGRRRLNTCTRRAGFTATSSPRISS